MKSNVDKGVVFWLLIGCFLVMVMVVVGGLTLLTHSGLSMVQWSLFMEIIPPLSVSDWEKTFQLYQLTPEFKLKNYHFTLEEFKAIFWWEYIHRMIGRLIGLVFIFPFCYFLLKKRIRKGLIRKLLLACVLGALQAGMGWFMVKSGLVKDPSVSHYRLAAHLIIAFILYGYLLWLVLDECYSDRFKIKTVYLRPVGVLIFLTLFQIVFGAFISGLKAGLVYNTFPMMGDRWIAESVIFAFEKNGMISFFENLASVQLVHRYLGLMVLIGALYLWLQRPKQTLNMEQAYSLKFLLIAVSLQVLLGIFTLLYAVPIGLAAIHQLGALVLFTSELLYYYYTLKPSARVG